MRGAKRGDSCRLHAMVCSASTPECTKLNYVDNLGQNGCNIMLPQISVREANASMPEFKSRKPDQGVGLADCTAAPAGPLGMDAVASRALHSSSNAVTCHVE